MPLTIPAFNQYQAPMPPLRGLWRRPPAEGDFFCNAEIDWFVTTSQSAVQFSLAGNSPVALSQIVALAVDNGLSGADVDFLFPDSGARLTVPAQNQLVAPVFTNALMFYASAPNAQVGDRTVFQIFNSMPPPVAWAASRTQNTATVEGIALTDGTTQVVDPSISGTLNGFNFSVTIESDASAGSAAFNLIDGTGKRVWAGIVVAPASGVATIPINVSGMSVRFSGGLSIVITNVTDVTGGFVVANVYFATP